MKKLNINKKYLEICIYTLCVVLLSIILGKIVWNIAGIGQSINNILNFLKSLLAPFIFGFFIAYFMNSTVRYLESVVFRRIAFFHTRAKTKRLLAITLTYVIYFGCLTWVISFLIPQVFDNTASLINKLPRDLQYYLDVFYKYLGGDSTLARFLTALNITLPSSYDLSELMNRILQPIITGLSSLTNVMNTLLAGTMNAANTALNFILGLFIAFYMLSDKEYYQELSKRSLGLLFKKRVSEKIIRAAALSNLTIEKFIIGKAIDSLIISLMFFFITLIMKPPYALLITLIVGITNMIPYFGPIVGAVIATLIVLPAKPDMAPWVLLVIFVLQQFDGAYLGPKILGDSIGLPPMLVIFAILIGRAVGGPLGMFFGVPILAIIRNLTSETLNNQYRKRMAANGHEVTGQEDT
ncbi:MAG: AI-2E family transporter [Clostridiales bacterium]|jgi:predicted PurR-regulated permease PerM|nr:AI-2E family transporter [Clostridiales bacterium]